MGKTHYRKILCKGTHEYVWDEDGKYIRKAGKFIMDKTNKDANKKLINEFNTLTKGHPYVKQRVKTIKNYEKKIYYAKVWILTEGNDLSKLKNHSKRGFKRYHLDHIYPISQGFKNDIPPEAISDMRNLKFIPAKKNLKKRDEVTKEGLKLIKEIQRKI